MKRPELFNFLAIETDDKISIRTSLTLKQFKWDHEWNQDLAVFDPASPWKSFGLLNSTQYGIKVIGLSEGHQEIYSKTFDSDRFGNFNFQIDKARVSSPLSSLQIYEDHYREGLELHLGTFIPLRLMGEKKIVISDFDKTLVDTKYSTTREIYDSITKPLEFFPRVDESIEKLKTFINAGFQPFILSASPHFYEEAIRDWLYQNDIYTAGLFLKDYRQVFSLIDGNLYPKDIKAQGFYKLNNLVDILLMTGIPEELILMGDGFESDTMIYLSLKTILTNSIEPWHLWNQLRSTDSFRLTAKQNSLFLNKLFRLKNLAQSSPMGKDQIQIFIRKPKDVELKIPLKFLAQESSTIQTYV